MVVLNGDTLGIYGSEWVKGNRGVVCRVLGVGANQVRCSLPLGTMFPDALVLAKQHYIQLFKQLYENNTTSASACSGNGPAHH